MQVIIYYFNNFFRIFETAEIDPDLIREYMSKVEQKPSFLQALKNNFMNSFLMTNVLGEAPFSLSKK